MSLKYLHINEKHHKKQLLISHRQVETLRSFLVELLQENVLIINTNLGLEFYYESSYDCTKIIKDTFAIVACKNCKPEENYRFFSFQNEHALQQFMNASMRKLVKMPLFRSYTKSTLQQLNNQFETHRKLIGKLLEIWHKVSQDLQLQDISLRKIVVFRNDFQSIYIQKVENEVLKNLFLEMFEIKHLN